MSDFQNVFKFVQQLSYVGPLDQRTQGQFLLFPKNIFEGPCDLWSIGHHIRYLLYKFELILELTHPNQHLYKRTAVYFYFQIVLSD